MIYTDVCYLGNIHVCRQLSRHGCRSILCCNNINSRAIEALKGPSGLLPLPPFFRRQVALSPVLNVLSSHWLSFPGWAPPGDGAHGGEPSPPAASQPSNKNHQLLQAQALVLQTREALHSSRDPLLLCLSLSCAELDIRDFFNLPQQRRLHSKCVRLYVSPPAPPLPPFLFVYFGPSLQTRWNP